MRYLVHSRRHRIARQLVVFMGVLACLAAITFGRSFAQGRPSAPAQPPPLAGVPRTADTYTALERQAVRVTTRFSDAIAVATRNAQGTLSTRVADLAGNELATVVVDSPDRNVRTMNFHAVDGRQLRSAAPANVRSTLDWTNEQAYRWLKNRDGDVQELRTEFAGGLTSRSRPTSGTRRHPATGQPVEGHGLLSRLLKDDLEAGASEWFAEQQAFAWSLPGLTTGYIDAARLDRTGGWPFTPDLAWMNVQNYAFYVFHSAIRERGQVAGMPAILNRVAGVFVASLQANEDGCDGLHWLDASIFRPCCDIHDQCYERAGCTSSSWWKWWSSWRCDFCNEFAVYCFMSKTLGQPFYPSPW